MNSVDLPLVFTFGLLGSPHCIGMCGPIVLAYSARQAQAGGRAAALLSHVFYNLGRIATYAALGALAGAAGKAIGLLSANRSITAIVAGILLILAGISFTGILPNQGLARLDPTRLLGRLHRAVGSLLAAPTRRSRFVLGLAMGFLPCGFLYAGLLKAMETADPLAGAGTMLAFGLGTAGALLLTGFLSSTIAAPLRRWGNWIAAACMIFLGAMMLYRGLMAHGMLPRSSPGDSQPSHGHQH